MKNGQLEIHDDAIKLASEYSKTINEINKQVNEKEIDENHKAEILKSINLHLSDINKSIMDILEKVVKDEIINKSEIEEIKYIVNSKDKFFSNLNNAINSIKIENNLQFEKLDKAS